MNNFPTSNDDIDAILNDPRLNYAVMARWLEIIQLVGETGSHPTENEPWVLKMAYQRILNPVRTGLLKAHASGRLLGRIAKYKNDRLADEAKRIDGLIEQANALAEQSA